MKRKLVLFDIDGTLLLSAGAGRRAIFAALAGLLSDTPATAGIRFDGKTDPQIVTELLAAAGHPSPSSPELIREVLERYVGRLEAELVVSGHHSRVMPGIPELLDRLEADSGVLLGLVTGNVAPGARLKLTRAGIAPERFVVGAFGSDHHSRGELPPIAARRAEPHFGRVPGGSEVVIIGDTPADVRCAEAIGARTVAVATGGYTVAELAATGADRVFADFSGVDEALEAILS
ncbi:MAG: HAD hydrolase-like protein [Gemmatimonadales bacterium]|nr:HAD hydrolase-like protein [Gemmatimonadales bacterium]